MGNYENLIKKEIRYTYTDDKTGEFISVSSVPESKKNCIPTIIISTKYDFIEMDIKDVLALISMLHSLLSKVSCPAMTLD